MARRGKVTRDLYNSMTNTDVISFGGGAPSPDTYPVDELRAIANELLQGDRGRKALAYNNPEGVRDMIEVVRDIMLPRRGITSAKYENILITCGGLETMNFACQTFIEKGDVILVEEPSYVQVLQIFDMFEAKLVPVECDENGVLVEDLIEKAEQYHPKMIYIIPSFHNPAARTTVLERCIAIAEYVNTHDVILLEGDPYVELRFKGEDLPAISSLVEPGRFIFANSFSKMFSPGSRLGYCFASEDIIRRVYDAKTATNSQTSTLDQMLCAEYFKRGYYEAHVEKCRAYYREKCDFAVECIRKYFPEGTKITAPDGGLFIWVVLPDNGPNTTELYDKAISDVHVAFLPGENFFIDPSRGRRGMRLSYGSLKMEDIDEGLRRLGGLIHQEMR